MPIPLVPGTNGTPNLLSVGVNAILIPPDLLRVFMPKGFFADHLDNTERNVYCTEGINILLFAVVCEGLT